MGGLKTAMDRSPVIRSLWIKVTDQHVWRVWIKAYHPWAWGIGNWGCEKPSFWEQVSDTRSWNSAEACLLQTCPTWNSLSLLLANGSVAIKNPLFPDHAFRMVTISSIVFFPNVGFFPRTMTKPWLFAVLSSASNFASACRSCIIHSSIQHFLMRPSYCATRIH